MNTGFGIFALKQQLIERSQLQAIYRSLSQKVIPGDAFTIDRRVGLGALQADGVSTSCYADHVAAGDFIATLYGRFDNRAELCDELGFAEPSMISDEAILFASYRRWGNDCVGHFLGDWAFALWDSAREQLLLARDATGNSVMYWFCNDNHLIFSNEIKAVLAHPAVPAAVDTQSIVGVLAVFKDPSADESTFYRGVKQLLPGTLLVATDSIQVRRWWKPEVIQPLRYGSVQEYYDAFLEIYDDAVARKVEVGSASIAASLSGGLDSGSVATLAAARLLKMGQRLTAYTHRPMFAPNGAAEHRVGDEFALAMRTAERAGNIDLTGLFSETFTVVQGLRTALSIHSAPTHAAPNEYWILHMLQSAQRAGATVLLTGQGGNATVSFSGNGSLLPKLLHGELRAIWFALRHDTAGFPRAVKRRLVNPTVEPLRSRSRWAKMGKTPWESYSAINPKFAQEYGLLEKMQRAGHDPTFQGNSPGSRAMRDFREAKWLAGTAGALWMEKGRAYGIEVRDPTLDRRLVEFCLGVPDEIFWANGVRRGFIRGAMARQLPQEVLAAPRGLQSADLGGRLATQSAEVMSALSEIERHPLCSEMLNLPSMRSICGGMSVSSTPAQVSQAAAILVRGLSVGLFLTRF